MNNQKVIGKAGKFNICFRDITLASHAGVVLVKEMVDRLGVAELIAQEIKVKQRQRGYSESRNDHRKSSLRSLNALVITETELKVIAALAIIGLSNSPVNG